MNLDDVLDVTEPVTVQFMNHEIVAHVYTAGAQRLTKEERELIITAEDARAALEDDKESQEHDLSNKKYSASIDSVRTVLPIIVKAIDLNGDPLVYKDKHFPENVPSFPDSLLHVVGDAALIKWNAANPTSGEQSPNGGPPAEKPEQSQAATTTP